MRTVHKNWRDVQRRAARGVCALCGGEGDRAAFPYSPYFRYGLPRFSWTTGRDLEREMAKRWRRRVLRLTPDGD